MKSFQVILQAIVTISLVIMNMSDNAVARPEFFPVHQGLIYQYPSTASQQTTVVRDVLGNQGTAYAYQNHDGISASVVAVSRSDNSKTLAYHPAVLPAIAAHQPLVYAHDHYQHAHAHAPAVAYSDYHSYV